MRPFLDPYANLRTKLRLPAQAMKTYRILSPKDTLIVEPCRKVGCRRYRIGWETILNESIPAHHRTAEWIRHHSGRTFREGRTASGWTVFRFDPYQRCFDDHRTRPQIFAVTGGDMRGNPLQTPPRRHQQPIDWVEDMQESLDQTRARIERG